MTHRVPLTLLLILSTDARPFFLVSEPALRRESFPRVAESRWGRLRARVHDAYESFKRRFDYQEIVCATLRHASSLTLVHPPDRSPDEVLGMLDDFLRERLARHRKWMIVDLILALPGTIMTPVPGPNIFFLYPAARALSHHFAVRGVGRVRELGPPPTRPDDLLGRVQNGLVALDDLGAEVKELERLYNVHRLRSLLEKI
jgi:hypothetical protein